MSRREYAAAVAALVLSLSLTACGTAANSGDPTASRTGTGNSGPDQRSARSAYDYLEDGHYSAARTGKIRDQAGRAERDFTQDVRDMLGDTEKAAKDIGQDAVSYTHLTSAYTDSMESIWLCWVRYSNTMDSSWSVRGCKIGRAHV